MLKNSGDRHLQTLDFIVGGVDRAAANDFQFQNRAARGSVCNGLFVGRYSGVSSIPDPDSSHILGIIEQKHEIVVYERI